MYLSLTPLSKETQRNILLELDCQSSLFCCAPGVSCGAPRPLENGLFQGKDFYAGSSVVYQCNDGFYLLGDTKVHCSNSGKWGGNPPSCLGKHCSFQVDLDFSSRTKTKHFSVAVCVCQMWMSALWVLTVIVTLDA